MWWAVCVLVSVVTVPPTRARVYQHDSYEIQDFDDDYYYEVSPPLSIRVPNTLTRMRRYGDGDEKTFNPKDKGNIKGALKALFSGRNVDFAPKRSSKQSSVERSNRRKITRSSIDTQDADIWLTPTRWHLTSPTVNIEQDWFRERAVLREQTTTTTTNEATIVISSTPTNDISTTITTSMKDLTTTVTSETSPKDVPTSVTTATPAKDISTDIITTKKEIGVTDTMSTQAMDGTATSTSIGTDLTGTTTAHFPTTVTTYFSTATIVPKYTDRTAAVRTTIQTEEPTTTTTMGPSGPKFDIEALLAIVANMTYDYDTNLTQQLNETLQRFSIPTCGFPTTTTTSTISPITTEKWSNTSIVAKCFVCGMDTPGIPRNTYCADAFATDFLPLVPISPRAKGHISRFRKYCRYLDVNNYQRNRSDPRVFLGRWSGGCAVRWVDLSGVYTQRTCRNRLRPTTGHHYGSKRMAKLELALANVDDGCVTSPMATLVPLSRGISLYGRFHACVCTGKWCNRAEVMGQTNAYLWLLFLIVVEAIRYMLSGTRYGY